MWCGKEESRPKWRRWCDVYGKKKEEDDVMWQTFGVVLECRLVSGILFGQNVIILTIQAFGPIRYTRGPMI